MRKVLIVALGLSSMVVSVQAAFASDQERTISWSWWPPGFVTTWAPKQPRGIPSNELVNSARTNMVGSGVKRKAN